MANTLKRLAGPAFIAAAATDIFAPAAATIFTVVKHIRVVNKDSSARTFTLYVGATGGSAAGTEIAKDVSIPVAGYVDLFFSPGLKMLSTDFMSGIASVVSTLVITVMGEQGVV